MGRVVPREILYFDELFDGESIRSDVIEIRATLLQFHLLGSTVIVFIQNFSTHIHSITDDFGGHVFGEEVSDASSANCVGSHRFGTLLILIFCTTRTLLVEEAGCRDTVTLIGTCRNVLRVIRPERRAQPEELRPALDEVEILSGKLDEVWHDGWRGYASLVYENEQTVVHSEEFVTDEGVHINQVECLWSLVNPWLQKFRGLSKSGLEQSVRTYGFVRTLNLAGAPLHGLLDCFILDVFH